MRSITIVLLAGITAFAAGCAKSIVGAPRADKDVPADREKIQGVWKIESVARDPDKPPPADEIANTRFVFKGNVVAGVTKRPGKEDRIDPISFRLDPTKDPKQIDLFELDEPGKSRKTGAEEEPTVKGIYKLDGDKLLFAFRKGGGTRPKDFKPEQLPKDSSESAAVIFTLTRTTEPVPEIKLKPGRSGTVSAKTPAATAASFRSK